MNNKQNILAACITLILMVSGVHNALSDYSSDKNIFENEIAKLDSYLNSRKDEALKQYGVNLKAAEEIFKSRGDIESLLAVRIEIERFSQSKDIDGNAELPAPIVSKIRDYYYDSLSRADDYKQKQCIVLSKKWLAYLLRSKTQLTRQGKIDEATKVSNEAEKLSNEILAMEAGFAPDTETQLAECPACKGVGYTLSECKTCKGKKKCKSCAGSGQKKGLNGMVKCVVCNGSGNCRTCDGAGAIKTPCSKCKGEKTIRVAVVRPEPEKETVAEETADQETAPPEEPVSAAMVEAELTEYIANMKSLYAMYNDKKITAVSFDAVTAEPGKYVGMLLSSTVKLNAAFPRGVYVTTDQGGGTTTKLMPYSHSVGNSATRLLKKAGAGSQVTMIYGLVNENNYTLFQIDAL